MAEKVHHVLSLSGGKDSTALAVYLRDRVQDMHYVFCDTDKELPETYEYLDKLQAYLGPHHPIHRLRDERGFDHWLQIYGGYLPSSRMRWCTKMLKIRPFERWIEEKFGNETVYMYIGIRADENRGGYDTSKPNIRPVYPFKDDGLTLQDVHRILEESRLGFPSYYSWRTRSGCYFCFYQRRNEWVGLKENHPHLFELAKRYEKTDNEKGTRYTWSERESLDELVTPERIAAIKAQQAQAANAGKKDKPNKPLLQVLGQDDEGDDDLPCSFCQI